MRTDERTKGTNSEGTMTLTDAQQWVKGLQERRTELHTELTNGLTPGQATEWFADRVKALETVNRQLDRALVTLATLEDEAGIEGEGTAYLTTL